MRLRPATFIFSIPLGEALMKVLSQGDNKGDADEISIPFTINDSTAVSASLAHRS